MICVRTPYHDERIANHTIKKSERSAIKRPNKPKLIRKAYKCPECGFHHIKKQRL